MGESKNIIDMRHGRAETGSGGDAETGAPLPDLLAPAEPEAAVESVPWLNEDDIVPVERRTTAAMLVAGLVIAAWTAAFMWAGLAEWRSGISLAEGVNALSQWAILVVLVLTVYLLTQRNSLAEGRRYAGIAQSLRSESIALDTRLSHINGELSLARAFLASQSQELDSLGRVSTDRLRNFAEELRNIIASSDQGMRAIGEVSEAASGNMDKLRTHLPVIATSAKDVTNQIGNAGRTAQVQIESMIAAFEKLNGFGQASSAQIDALVTRADIASRELTATFASASAQLGQSVDAARQQIDASVNSASNHLAGTQSQLQHSGEAQAATLRTLLSDVQAQSDAITAQIAGRADETTGQLDRAVAAQQQALATLLADLQTGLDNMAAAMEARAADSRAAVREAGDDLGLTLETLATSSRESEAVIRNMVALADTQISEAEARLLAFDTRSADSAANLAFALSALQDNVAKLSQAMDKGANHAEAFQAKSEQLGALLTDIDGQIASALPKALGTLDDRTTQSIERVGALQQALGGVDTNIAQVLSLLAEIEARIASQDNQISALVDGGKAGWATQAQEIETLIAAMRTAREDIEEMEANSGIRLIETMRDVQREAREAANESARALDAVITGATDKLGAETAITLEQVLRTKAEELIGKLDGAINRAVGATSEATLHLKDQLVRVDDLASHLERRVSEARERAEERTDNEFARRLALLTESLNSAAIDISKILSTEVSDTAWSAYLRGDRGVFTRRAVRLLDSAEARTIAQAYQNDDQFYELVNRFIHDFEAMLRNVLSTRDGGVIGVTLLSSETGKLYVALAQAIERLRD
ncbi:hypothetical protein [Blastomonas sp.]|uniref:hypothetical protein n=1 Tax=Blastomonas sp. TaxID=1909299 RepID=UPI00359458BF